MYLLPPVVGGVGKFGLLMIMKTPLFLLRHPSQAINVIALLSMLLLQLENSTRQHRLLLWFHQKQIDKLMLTF